MVFLDFLFVFFFWLQGRSPKNPNKLLSFYKRSSFPSNVECHLSFIIDISPIFYYSLAHKWLTLRRAHQTHNSIQKYCSICHFCNSPWSNEWFFLRWGWHTRFWVPWGTVSGRANLAEKLGSNKNTHRTCFLSTSRPISHPMSRRKHFHRLIFCGGLFGKSWGFKVTECDSETCKLYFKSKDRFLCGDNFCFGRI